MLTLVGAQQAHGQCHVIGGVIGRIKGFDLKRHTGLLIGVNPAQMGRGDAALRIDRRRLCRA